MLSMIQEDHTFVSRQGGDVPFVMPEGDPSMEPLVPDTDTGMDENDADEEDRGGEEGENGS